MSFKSATPNADALLMDLATLPLAALSGESQEPPRVEDFERVQHYLHAYLAGERFKCAHREAYERWTAAATTLYRESSNDAVSAAGARVREAIEEFARSLAQSRDPARGNSDSTRAGDSTPAGIDRLSSVIETCRPHLGDSRCDLLHSLCRYWLVLDGAVRRQARSTHGGDASLGWEDGRRLVVLTALVMVEVDRSF